MRKCPWGITLQVGIQWLPVVMVEMDGSQYPFIVDGAAQEVGSNKPLYLVGLMLGKHYKSSAGLSWG